MKAIQIATIMCQDGYPQTVKPEVEMAEGVLDGPISQMAMQAHGHIEGYSGELFMFLYIAEGDDEKGLELFVREGARIAILKDDLNLLSRDDRPMPIDWDIDGDTVTLRLAA